ncbi:PAP/fibrillin family protein [Trichothermofontia sp.]
MLGKAALLDILAGKNRGLSASARDRQAILAAIAQLEDRNPTPRPTAAVDRLAGDWRLLYTTSQELLGIDRVPLAQLGPIYQCIRVQNAQIYNIAEVTGPPFLDGIVSVKATFTPVSERRVNVHFERFIVGLQRLINYRSPADFIRQLEAGKRFAAIDVQIDPQKEQRGWLEITYLDEDLRIGRGNEGNVFVLSKS